jgi:hypothetical protein
LRVKARYFPPPKLSEPPSPWHIGIAPKGQSSTFVRPDDGASRRSLAIDPVDGNNSRDRLAVTITALVKVSEMLRQHRDL